MNEGGGGLYGVGTQPHDSFKLHRYPTRHDCYV